MNHLKIILKLEIWLHGDLYSSDAITGEMNPRQMTGVITNIYLSPAAGRKVWFAKVFEATSGQFYNMSLMTLSLLKD